MKLLQTYLIVLLVLPFALSGQLLDFELGVLDIGILPANEKSVDDKLVSNNKIYLITSNNGDYDLLQSDGDTTLVLIKDQDDGMAFQAKLDDGILFTRGSFSSTLYLYFLDHETDEITELYEFEHNIKDINVVNGKAIFVDWHDRLLVSDGTPAGTIELIQFADLPYNEGVELATESFVFLRADDQLWRTDGTVAGTIIVDELDYSSFEVIETGGGHIYYSKSTFSPSSNQIWRADGINPPEVITDVGVVFTDFDKVAANDDGVYFIGETNEYGREFWRCDTESLQSELVMDILPGPESGISDELINSFEVVTEDQVTFFRGGGVNEGQVWKTDGTTSGTSMAIDFTGLPGYEDFEINENYLVRSEDNKDYFFTNSDDDESKLWVYEHALETLTFLSDIGASYFSEFQVSGSKYYFTYYNSGDQLWVTDGTVAGTINTGVFANLFGMLGAHNELLYYTRNVSGIGEEVYVTDGSLGSGSLLKDIHPAPNTGSYPEHFFIYNNQALFYAVDDVIGQSLYKTDGTTNGTVSEVDLYRHTGGANPEYLTKSGGKLYFAINDTLWASDGTVEGAVKLNARFNNNSEYWGETNSHLYFTYDGDLYATDGTPEGTDFLLEGADFFNDELTDFSDFFPVELNNVLYFFYDNSLDGIELYSSNGTPGGTQMVFESLPFEESIFIMGPNKPIRLGDRFFFANQDATSGNELWSSDGTLAGTTLFADLETGTGSSSPKNFVVFKNKIFFQGYSSSGGNTNQAWVTDGTLGGTTVLGNTRFDTGGKVASIGEDLFYIAINDLWKTNGTPEGTVLVLENNSAPYQLTSYGNKIAFGLENASNDIEPWVSDGTTAGTYMLKDVDPADDSSPDGFTVFQNLLFFAADTINYGNNVLWLSEGDEATTRRAPFERQELNELKGFTKLNNRLYFTANGEVFREEVYYLEFNIPVETIKGEVFQDANGNGVKDQDEIGFGNVKILAESDEKYYTYTDTTGGYEIHLPEGTYEVSSVLPSCSEITTDSSSYHIEVADMLVTGLDFGLMATPDSQSMNINMISAVTRCGFTIPVWVNVGNNGCDTAATVIVVELDSAVTFVESDIPPASIVDQTLTWTLNTLEIGAQEQIKMMLTMPDETFVNDTINMLAESFLWDSDTLALSSAYNYRSIIRCAIDPNDKQVTPDRTSLGDENYTLFDEKMTFQVRFQNTGNDTAFTVRIIDTLSNLLDLSTFQPIAASHPYEVSLSPQGVLDFVFENILLPDSTTNEAESHGFILFEIYPREDIDEFSVIHNTAYIYFDFNSAIVTNTTGSTMVSSFDMDDDGLDIWTDCDDNDPNAGNGVEIPYNGIDEDCDPLTLDDDLDGDGFDLVDDCDDMNDAINPDVTEIPYNGIDEDCDPLTPDDDLDGDGFVFADDCDDMNDAINPGVIEIPYNGIDEDCDPLTPDDDLDGDGFIFADDCDDTNAAVNSDAVEIPNNGIDEDCDGEDLIVGVNDLSNSDIKVYPNPTTGELEIILPAVINAKIELRNYSGQILMNDVIRQQGNINISAFPTGVYLLFIKTENNIWVERLIKID